MLKVSSSFGQYFCWQIETPLEDCATSNPSKNFNSPKFLILKAQFKASLRELNYARLGPASSISSTYTKVSAVDLMKSV